MFRLSLLIVVLLALLLVPVVSLAQEETPAPTLPVEEIPAPVVEVIELPPDEPVEVAQDELASILEETLLPFFRSVITSIAGIAVSAVVTVAGLAFVLGRFVYRSVPPEMGKGFLDAVQRTTEGWKVSAAGDKNPFNDPLTDLLDSLADRVVEQIRSGATSFTQEEARKIVREINAFNDAAHFDPSDVRLKPVSKADLVHEAPK